MLAAVAEAQPLGPPGSAAEFRHENTGPLRASVVRRFTVRLGPVENVSGRASQWWSLAAVKENGGEFAIWLLQDQRGAARYILREGAGPAREYRNALTGLALLPSHGAWPFLVPESLTGARTRYLGHTYVRERFFSAGFDPPPVTAVVELRPDLLVGPASNTRQKDDHRRWDNSDYELVLLTRDDYREMRDAGVTCVRAGAGQAAWADELGLFYWDGGADLPFPESLYRSQYLGAALYLDEPAVGTRDHVIRPRLERDPAYRKSITPQAAFSEFEAYFAKALAEGAPSAMMRRLRSRTDVDIGGMDLVQSNLYTWETMVETAAWQLSRDPRVPAAFVFEPPGRVGTRRTLPEMDMTYGVQIPPEDPRHLTDLLFAFLRGAARATDKHWGVSIYGAVDRSDAPYWLTRAYDLGATRFHFWDNYRLACVPYREVLALSRHLRDHAGSRPRRDLDRLRRAAETAIVFPRGYGLGHVMMGKGSLWGVGELNLERINSQGVKHRAVMSNLFREIERCLRLGVAFDVLWDVPGLPLAGYREVIRVTESVAKPAVVPARPGGAPPALTVTTTTRREGGRTIVTAKAVVRETSAPVYYTFGADTTGVYRNAKVAWELYGPGDEDHVFFIPERLEPKVDGDTVLIEFPLPRPGRYRLRAATVDTAGRSTVEWRTLTAP